MTEPQDSATSNTSDGAKDMETLKTKLITIIGSPKFDEKGGLAKEGEGTKKLSDFYKVFIAPPEDETKETAENRFNKAKRVIAGLCEAKVEEVRDNLKIEELPIALQKRWDIKNISNQEKELRSLEYDIEKIQLDIDLKDKEIEEARSSVI